MLSFSFTLLEFEYNSFVNERKEGSIHRDIIQKVVDSSIRSTSPYFCSYYCMSSWMITIRSMYVRLSKIECKKSSRVMMIDN